MICVPIMAASTEEGLTLMDRSFPEADLVELRLDSFGEIDMERLLGAAKGPVLVTNRSSREGGLFRGDEEERIGLLLEAIRLGAAYVDCELGTDRAFLERLVESAREGGGRTKIIFSFHDFQGTPSTEQLRDCVEKAFSLGCHAAKVVTMATTMDDNLRMLELLRWAGEQQRSIVAFCMGPLGKITRLAAPLFGSLMTFASLESGRESAPGQIALKELKKALELVRP